MNLLTEWYVDPVPARRQELHEVLRLNLENPVIEAVHLFGIADELFLAPRHDKIRTVPVTARPTFADLFAYAADTLAGKVCAIANADIFFDGTIERLAEIDLSAVTLCLTRWDVTHSMGGRFNNNPGSQDAWIFRSPLLVPEATFPMGLLACDKRLAALLAAQRAVANPSLSIRAWHLHVSAVRRDSVNLIKRLPPPYLAVAITELPDP